MSANKMRANKRKREAPEYLSGWKDVANYLGKGVRTVQRYERQMGLPVRRPAGKPSGSVVATKAEIDAWVAASPIREAYHLSKQTRNPRETALAALAALDKGAAEMQRLRDQMQSLRQDLRSTVTVLQTTVAGLQLGLRSTSQHLSDPYDSQTEESSNLLRIDMGQRKAS